MTEYTSMKHVSKLVESVQKLGVQQQQKSAGALITGEARSITAVTTARTMREGGGFVVRRPVGGRELDKVDPFLMLDHLPLVYYGPGEAVGAPDHPHRGFETVTYMLRGGMHHRDSVGNQGLLGPGWVQWMTAGKGVIHSEMPIPSLLEKGGWNEGFQLWVNLPARDKMMQPRYQDVPPTKIPIATTEDGLVSVRVITGQSLGVDAVIDTRTPILFLDVRMKRGGSLRQAIPKSYSGFVYVFRGRGLFGAKRTLIADSQTGQLGEGEELSIECPEEVEGESKDTRSKLPREPNDQDLKEEFDEARGTVEQDYDWSLRCLLICGVPLNEPVAKYGPFVMNYPHEIQEAFKDYQSGALAAPIQGAEERSRLTKEARARQKETGKWKEL